MSSIKSLTEGNELKLILAFGTPLLFGNILQQLYNFVDTVVVGRGCGVDALAAVGLAGPINFLILGFVMGLAQGVTILVSQYFGAGDAVNLRKSVTMSALVNYGAGFIITIVSVAATRWILLVIGTPEEILEDAVLYLHIVLGGCLISLTYNFLSGILRALGDSRNPLIAMIIAFLVNTALDIWFVMSLHMGVAGAAWATVIAQGVSGLYCLWCAMRIDLLQLSKSDWNWDGAMFKKSVVLSLPVALMNSITAVGVLILQAAINAFGSVYIAAYSTASKVIILLEQISSTYGYAAGTFVGQNLGAGKMERIRKGVFQINLAVIAMNMAAALLVHLFGRQAVIMMVSSSEPEVIEIAYHSMCLLSDFLFALGILWCCRCALQGMSDTFFPMLSGLLEFASRSFFVWLLPAKIGFDGTLLAESSAWISAAIMLVIVYLWRMKKNMQVIPPVNAKAGC